MSYCASVQMCAYGPSCMQFSAYVRMDGFNVVQNVHHVIRDGWNHPWAKEEYASFSVYHGQP